MRLRHIGYIGIFLALVFLVNSKLQIIPGIVFKGFAGLIVAAGVVYGYLKYFDRQMLQQQKGIPAEEGFDRVQEYLKEQPGKYKIDEEANDKIHEGTMKVDQNGEIKRMYSVIGREFKPGSYEPDTIRVIWNLTDNDFEWYDGYVPGKHRSDPYFNIDKFLKVEGYKLANTGKDQDRQQPTVYVDNQGNRQNPEVKDNE